MHQALLAQAGCMHQATSSGWLHASGSTSSQAGCMYQALLAQIGCMHQALLAQAGCMHQATSSDWLYIPVLCALIVHSILCHLSSITGKPVATKSTKAAAMLRATQRFRLATTIVWP